jgi:hypothetical protein
MTSTTSEWSDVAWTRSIQCAVDRVELTDTIVAGKPHDYSLQFTLAPEVRAEVKNNSQVILNKGDMNIVMKLSTEVPFELSVIPGENFQTDPALPIQQLRVVFKGVQNLRLTTVFA